jgi:hypothetical protein
MTLLGLAPPMPNRPTPGPIMPPMFVGISMPNLHFSASRSRSKQPVPMRASWPSMMASETPRIGSTSA